MEAFNKITTAFGGKKINVSDALTGGMEAATHAVDRFAKVVSSHHTQIKEFFSSFKTGSAASLKIFANVMLDLSKVLLPVLDELAKYPKTTAAVVTSLLLASKAVKGLSVAVEGLQIMRTVGSTIGSFTTKIKNIPSRKITRIQVDGAKSTRDLEAYSRRLDRIPKSKTTKAIVNTASAETSLTRLGTKATASGKLGLKGLSLIGRGAKIASAGLDLVGGPAGGIMLLVQGLTIVYQHDKKFRKFVNGLASSAKSAMGKMGKAFESGAKSAISWTSNMWDRVKRAISRAKLRLNNRLCSMRVNNKRPGTTFATTSPTRRRI